MDETLVLTVEDAVQAGDVVFIFPSLSADEYYLTDVEKVKVITPDHQVVEKDAYFSIPLGTSSYIYQLIIPNSQKEEIPLGSQIWIQKPLDQITRRSDTTEG